MKHLSCFTVVTANGDPSTSEEKNIGKPMPPTHDYTTTLSQRMLVHRMVAAKSTGNYLPTLPYQSSRKKRNREPSRILL
jgi:hypothetical protein